MKINNFRLYLLLVFSIIFIVTSCKDKWSICEDGYEPVEHEFFNINVRYQKEFSKIIRDDSTYKSLFSRDYTPVEVDFSRFILIAILTNMTCIYNKEDGCKNKFNTKVCFTEQDKKVNCDIRFFRDAETLFMSTIQFIKIDKNFDNYLINISYHEENK